MGKFAVVAIGGNSLIRDKNRRRVEDQYQAIVETAVSLVDIIELGYRMVVTHGNGAQVGFILRRSEIAFKSEGMHFVPLVSCVADTQGAIGYQIQQALNNEFKVRGIDQQAVTVITQVKVDGNDPAFDNPSKPIGAFYTEKEMKTLTKSHPDWNLVEDAGRGYRRVVPSPRPIEIIERQAIQSLVNDNFCVISVGGGGIPVLETGDSLLKGIDAVIDKDYSAALLARDLSAETLIISTGVDHICLNYGTAEEKPLSRLTLSETRQYIDEGHFAKGSMLPKMRAIVEFLEQGGEKAIIAQPEHLKQAVQGEIGTWIVNDA
ncbi:MAG: carbamate kinase [Deltaproteobacteria bacterium]|jgi:carbamate kinase|nr:carbamate kinase [Deltaproteobacteria bacterium]